MNAQKDVYLRVPRTLLEDAVFVNEGFNKSTSTRTSEPLAVKAGLTHAISGLSGKNVWKLSGCYLYFLTVGTSSLRLVLGFQSMPLFLDGSSCKCLGLHAGFCCGKRIFLVKFGFFS